MVVTTYSIHKSHRQFIWRIGDIFAKLIHWNRFACMYSVIFCKNETSKIISRSADVFTELDWAWFSFRLGSSQIKGYPFLPIYTWRLANAADMGLTASRNLFNLKRYWYGDICRYSTSLLSKLRDKIQRWVIRTWYVLIRICWLESGRHA